MERQLTPAEAAYFQRVHSPKQYFTGFAPCPEVAAELDDDEDLLPGPLLSEQSSSPQLWALYMFAFWSQFQPSEPFLVDYFVHTKGLTNQQVYREIFNLFVYFRLPFIVLVGLVSEIRRFGSRVVLVTGACCGFITVLLTRFGESLLTQQVAQFTVAAAFASRIAVHALVFVLAAPARAQESVHELRAVLLLSNFSSAVLGEVLRDYVGVPLDMLFDISACGQAMSIIFALLLPGPEPPSSLSRPGVSEDTDVDCDQVLGSMVRVSSAGSPHSLPAAWRSGLSFLKSCFTDLLRSLWLKTVMWWTAWALVMNPVHGLALTFWQSLVRAKGIINDHNGYLLACMYFIAAVLTLLSGRATPFRRWTSELVIASMLGAACLLCMLVSESRQLPIYGWLLLYQCLFEVMTAVATFQVGYEVTTAPRDAQLNTPLVGRAAQVKAPGTSRLTLLFSATALMTSVNENAILLAISIRESMVDRFRSLGLVLGGFAFVLAAIRIGEGLRVRDTLASARRLLFRRQASEGAPDKDSEPK